MHCMLPKRLVIWPGPYVSCQTTLGGLSSDPVRSPIGRPVSELIDLLLDWPGHLPNIGIKFEFQISFFKTIWSTLDEKPQVLYTVCTVHQARRSHPK